VLDAIGHEDTAAGMKQLYAQHGISADRIASVVAFAIDLPEDTTVNEFTVGPANQPW
jgi:NADP-dependent 3-hydroxy acid dehydrogenase YdfG